MKPTLYLISILLLLSQSVLANDYIVKFKNNINKSNLNLLKAEQLDVTSTIPQLNMAVVSGDETLPLKLQKNVGREIEYIEKNVKIHLYESALSDPWDGETTWGLRAAKVSSAWPVTHGSRDVVIAISDTGTYLGHYDLKDNLWKNKGEIGTDAQGKDKSKNNIDDDGNGYVDDVYGYNFETNTSVPNENHYHGTHVAGTIGAVGGNGGLVGVAGKVSLMTVKFISASGSGTDDAAIKTIVYAADNGARAVNCSWGSDEYTQSLYDAIDYARKKGVIIVAAAGNDGANHDATPHYPSGYNLDNIITVAATTDASGQLASFSNYGKKSVHIAAPGDKIQSTFNPMWPTGYCGNSGTTNFYCYLSGTSMAAPHVSGALAMVFAVNPKLNYKQARDIILSTAAPSVHLADKVATGGQLDVGAAVRKAASVVVE